MIKKLALSLAIMAPTFAMDAWQNTPILSLCNRTDQVCNLRLFCYDNRENGGQSFPITHYNGYKTLGNTERHLTASDLNWENQLAKTEIYGVEVILRGDTVSPAIRLFYSIVFRGQKVTLFYIENEKRYTLKCADQ